MLYHKLFIPVKKVELIKLNCILILIDRKLGDSRETLAVMALDYSMNNLKNLVLNNVNECRNRASSYVFKSYLVLGETPTPPPQIVTGSIIL